MKKTFWILISCLALSIFIVSVLFSYGHKNKNIGNGFTRTYLKDHITLIADKKIEELHYISGVSKKSIFLSNPDKPNTYLELSFDLRKERYHKIPAYNNSIFPPKVTFLKIDTTSFFLTNHRSGNFFYKLNNVNQKIGKLDFHNFTSAFYLSDTSAVLFTYNEKLKKRVITKRNYRVNKYSATYFLEKKGDGMFTLDGKLHFHNSHLFYIYYYKNKILKLDTNLNLIFQTNTIDTNKTAKVHSFDVSNTKYTTIVDPTLVNANSFVYDKKILIYSKLRADNDSFGTINKNHILDVYNQENGKYAFSFLIPKKENQPIIDLAVSKNTLVVLTKNYLETYNLNF